MKSRRIRLSAAMRPVVQSHNENGVTIYVGDHGSTKGVTFTMAWWVFRNFCRDVRGHARAQSQELTQSAANILQHVNDQT